MPARSGTDAAPHPSPADTATTTATTAPATAAGPPTPDAAPNGPAHTPPAPASVWASREYRALWAASGWSLVGDQLARVALTVMLFQATGSASAAAWGGAVTFLAPVIGGLLLSGAGDRWPRRQVMVTCDLISAVLIAAMAMPGLPLAVMVVLLGAASLLYAPFNAARMALTRDVFPDNERAAKAIGTNTITLQLAILSGALIGGTAVTLVGARGALLVDAATFLLSAALVRRWVAARPPARPGGDLAAEVVGSAGSTLRLIFTDPALRTGALYAWLPVFLIAPSGVAALYAAELGGGARLLGVLLAAPSAGLVAGTVVLHRLPFAAQQRWMVPGAVLACVPLAATATDPGLAVVLVLWTVAGLGSSYMMITQTLFMAAVPNHRRAQAGGLVSSLMLGVQGAGMLAAAALADATSPATAVAVFGTAGTLAALTLAPAGRRLTTPRPAVPAGDGTPAGTA